MDRRAYILPVLTLVFLTAVLLRPDITGFMVAQPEERASVNITVTVTTDGFIPEHSVVSVSLDGRNTSMDFGEFVKRTKMGYNRTMGSLPEADYEGYGFSGTYEYTLDISEFGYEALPPGTHELVLELSYGDYVILRRSQTIEI